MIFRNIQRRRVRRVFGKFLSDEGLDKVMSELSEWNCFLLILPRWARPLFGRQPVNPESLPLLPENRNASMLSEKEPN